MKPEIWAVLTEADKKVLNEYHKCQFHRLEIPDNILCRSKFEAYGVISRLAQTPNPLDSSGSQLKSDQQERFSEMAQKCEVAYP